jgi:PAS domain S-box-containing protein
MAGPAAGGSVLITPAEIALRQSEERYRTLVEAVREIICAVTTDGRFVSFNPAFGTLTGWRDEDWIGAHFAGLLPADDLPRCVAAFEIALRGETGPLLRHRLRKRDGGWLAVESTAAPLHGDGRVVGVLGVVRDVTDRARAEEELAESRRRLDALFANALDAILLVDHEGRYVDANPAAEELLGYTRGELLGLRSSALVPPDWRPHSEEVGRLFADTGRYSGDYRLLRKDGAVRDAEFRAVANILPGLHLAVVRDITDRKKAEEHLLRTTRRLVEAEEVAHVGSWEWDIATGALTWTDEHFRIMGLPPSPVAPRYEEGLAIIHPEDRPTAEAACAQAARDGGAFAFDVRIVRPDGEIRVVHSRGRAVRGAQGRVERLIGVAQDITDRKRNEQAQRALVRRLLTIQEEERGRLSRELHDGTGQALTALLVGLRHLAETTSIEEARLVASRQRELLAQTLDDVGRLARGLRPVTLDGLGLKVALERHAVDQSWRFGFEVSVDAFELGTARLPGEIETALYRMVQEAVANAAQHARARHVHIALRSSGQSVTLVVSDDGQGFEVDRASVSGGLGLHTLRERAELLGGRCDLRSAPGQGTTVSIVVPLPAEAAARKRPRAKAGRARR